MMQLIYPDAWAGKPYRACLTPARPAPHSPPMLLPASIFDDFLGPEASGQILEFALARQDQFRPSTVFSNAAQRVNPDFRASLTYGGEFGDVLAPFHDALARRRESLRKAAGTGGFEPELQDLSLVAHCDGHLFKRHIDTATGHNRGITTGDRVLSLVYYVHRTPRAFSGGNLVMHALIGEERSEVIEPRHDRLVAFSSMAPHEVEPISLPGNDFAGARFAVVGWFCKSQRQATAAD